MEKVELYRRGVFRRAFPELRNWYVLIESNENKILAQGRLRETVSHLIEICKGSLTKEISKVQKTAVTEAGSDTSSESSEVHNSTIYEKVVRYGQDERVMVTRVESDGAYGTNIDRRMFTLRSLREVEKDWFEKAVKKYMGHSYKIDDIWD